MTAEKKPFAVSTQPNIWNEQVITCTLGLYSAIAIVPPKAKADVINSKTLGCIAQVVHTTIKLLVGSRLNELKYTDGGIAQTVAIRKNPVYRNLTRYTTGEPDAETLACNIKYKLIPLFLLAAPGQGSIYYPGYMHHYAQLKCCYSYILQHFVQKQEHIEA